MEGSSRSRAATRRVLRYRRRIAVMVAAVAAMGTSGGLLAIGGAGAAPSHPLGHASLAAAQSSTALTPVFTPQGHRPLGIFKPATPGSIGAPNGTPTNAAGTAYTCLTTETTCSPLVYGGGHLMGTKATPGLNNVYAVYWDPTTTKYPWPSKYKSTINQYLTDIAHTSAKTNDVYSVQQQYTGTFTGASEHLRYDVKFGGAITLTTAFPTSGCTAGGSDTGDECLTDAQEQAQLTSYLAAHTTKPKGYAAMYIVYFPQNVATCFTSGGLTCSTHTLNAHYCGYHDLYTDGGTPVVYANMPFPYTCDTNSTSPNGTLPADMMVSVTSHEENEATTDPGAGGYRGAGGYEIGDNCAYQYGTTAGGYNQTVNGHHYITQLEWSNEDQVVTKGDKGCIATEELPTTSFTATATAKVGATVTVTAAASKDPDSSAALTYSWSWGDATPAGSGVTTKHKYTSTGTFTITLTVTTADGWTNTTKKSVKITPAVPAKPTGVTATPGTAKVKVSWSTDAGATSYKVFKGTTPGAETYTTPACTTAALTCTVTGLTNGTKYYFTVKAHNGTGTSPASTEVSATPLAKPGKPTGVTATPGTAKVKVSWSTDAGATSYKVFKGTTPGAETYTTPACTTAALTCTVTGLTNGTKYYFTVKASNASGTSPASTEVSATPLAKPGKPTGVTASPGTAKVKVSWSTDAGATSYKVYDSTTSGGENYGGAAACSATAPTTSCTVTGLTNGTKYYFTVKASNTTGTSTASTQVTATPLAKPTTPTGVTATPATSRVTVAWSSVTGATSYKVFDSTVSGGENYTGAAACTVSAPTHACTIFGLGDGTKYYFTVVASNAAGSSPPSAQVTATPLFPPAPPLRVAVVSGDAQVTVSWTKVYGATSYAVYDSTFSGGENYTGPPACTATGSTTCTVHGLTNGTEYYFTVVTIETGNRSTPSVQRYTVPRRHFAGFARTRPSRKA